VRLRAWGHGRSGAAPVHDRAGDRTEELAADSLDQIEAGEEVGDLEGGGIGGVGTVSAVGADAGAEVVADGAGGGFLWISRAHRVAPFGDGAFGFEDHGDDFAGGHKVGEFAEEGASFVDSVEAAGFFLGEAHGFDGDGGEAGFVDAREDIALLIGFHRVGLDDCERSFECQENRLLEI